MRFWNSPAPLLEPARFGLGILVLVALALGVSLAALATDPEIDPLELQTLRDIHSLVLCVEAFQLDNGTVPGPTDGLVSVEFLRPSVEPFYIRWLPILDGWGNPFLYWSDGNRFTLVSHGADGIANRVYLGEVEFADGDDDIVVVDGAAVAVPLHLRPLIRAAEQKATMADMRSIATSVEVFNLDHGSYPGPTPGQVDVVWIREHVQPDYIRNLPLEDAWGTPFIYWSDGVHYRIASLGLDRRQDRPFEEIEPDTPTSSFESDIVFEDSAFKQYPQGDQR